MKHIEIATLDHLDEFAALFNSYRIFYRQPSNVEIGKAFLKERITNKETTTFLVKADGKFVGFAQLYPLYHYKALQKQWLLSDLFVDPDFRGRGLSVDLIDRCKLFCDETDACGLLLETEKTNEIGNILYPKCGFELDNDHNYYNWWKKA
ncbi:GNAT family N-acetyltransferase [Flavobacterium branchiarum]|uniref:GNAT family N-acetyltransferase n=1 Tax=Flavobacterium branchiarum TaxID=1114870 RepID=A0ABV5FIE2_9FLAO|nr:GNAT family N-acetyltransferase [Flavobacterium branchiarum]MDN3674210.1 GNAT family N-acetyltransferase [Flavobacterium branchiarum]